MAADIENLVNRLQQQEVALVAARDALNENTKRSRASFLDKEQQLGAVIARLSTTPRDLEAEQVLITRLEGERTTVLTKRTELEQQLAEAPDWRVTSDSRDYDRQHTLQEQLLRLRAGTLLCAPNRCYARVEDLDAQLMRSQERIERLQAQLAICLQQAEALLTEPVER